MASAGQSVQQLAAILKTAYIARRNAAALAEEVAEQLARLGGTTFTDTYFDDEVTPPSVSYTKSEFNNAMSNVNQMGMAGVISDAVESTYTAVTGPVKAID